MAYITIDFERCKGCELCTVACPEGLISISDQFNAKGYRPAQFTDPESKCKACAICGRVCPDVAIEVYR